jgi:hypothetical protein
MEGSMWEAGRKGNSMEKVFILGLIKCLGKESGMKEGGLNGLIMLGSECNNLIMNIFFLDVLEGGWVIVRKQYCIYQPFKFLTI